MTRGSLAPYDFLQRRLGDTEWAALRWLYTTFLILYIKYNCARTDGRERAFDTRCISLMRAYTVGRDRQWTVGLW